MEIFNIPSRPRRNRKNSVIRELVRENSVESRDLIAPLFLLSGENKKIPIDSMPGQFRLSLDNLIEEAKELWQLGVSTIALFPVIDESLKTHKGVNPKILRGSTLRPSENLKRPYLKWF